MKKFFRFSGVTNVHNQHYTLHLAEFVSGANGFGFGVSWDHLLGSCLRFLLADLIANVHHQLSLKNVTGPLMTATNAAQLETLRNNCFPDVPAVPCPPVAPAVRYYTVTTTMKTSRHLHCQVLQRSRARGLRRDCLRAIIKG